MEIDDAGVAPLAVDAAAVRPSDAGGAVDAAVAPSCGEACRPVSLALGGGFSCVLGADGSVRCWGRGQDGELGDGARRHRPGCRRDEDCSGAPVRVAFPRGARAIEASG
ncbi:MAG: hypothetical protein M3Y87_37595, partial [Myxococcota bacterium]|nr:hypothetical protein [Myxococcota bacterium]